MTPYETAVALGYPPSIIHGASFEPDGTVVVTIEDSAGEPLQVVHDRETGAVI